MDPAVVGLDDAGGVRRESSTATNLAVVLVAVLLVLLVSDGLRPAARSPRPHQAPPSPTPQPASAQPEARAASLSVPGFPAAAPPTAASPPSPEAASPPLQATQPTAASPAVPPGYSDAAEFRRRWQPGEAASELRSVIKLVAEGPGWALFCYEKPTIIGYGVPSKQRCYAHRRRCADPRNFRVYAYPLADLPPGPGVFMPGLHRALRDPASPVSPLRTDDPSEACVFLPGIDTFLFGHLPGQLAYASGPVKVAPNRTIVGGDALLEWWHPHGSPPYSVWLPNATPFLDGQWKAPGGRPLWGLNHFSFAYSDWGIDSESFYTNRGMLPVRSSSTSDAYQRFVDISIPLPKVSRPAPESIQQSRSRAAAERPYLLFFSGASYSFESPRYQTRLLRSLGSDIQIFIYCYEKYKAGQRGRVRRGREWRKWEAMRIKCMPETQRAVAGGFMPDFQKAGGTRRAPTTNQGKSAQEYQRMMQSSTFCVIIRGWGIHSYRLTESLQMGCVPVVLQPGSRSMHRGDETYLPRIPVSLVMPLNDTVDWPRVAVYGTEDELYTEEGRSALVKRLRDLKARPGDVNTMQRLGWEAHDGALGGDGINASMQTMLSEVLRTWRWRAGVYEEVLAGIHAARRG